MKQLAAKPEAVYLLEDHAFELVYGLEERQEIAAVTQIYKTPLTPENWQQHAQACSKARIIFSGWGMPLADAAFLAHFPSLEAIFYAAGSVRSFTTDALWQRNIVVISAWQANAVPVAEFSVAQIILSMKHVWRLSSTVRATHSFPVFRDRSLPGMYRSVVGLISLGAIGRKVAELLRPFDVKVLACDPFVSASAASELGVTLCSLDELFRCADAVSCHAPLTGQTNGMLTGAHFASMKSGATFINTSRGGIVNEAEMAEVLRVRPDLTALLDVTWPEPPVHGSPLYTLPNVWITPHVAGSIGRECERMGRMMADELRRYLGGTALEYQLTREQADRMA